MCVRCCFQTTFYCPFLGTTPLKTNMTGWKITILSRRYIFIHGCSFHCHVSFGGILKWSVIRYVGISPLLGSHCREDSQVVFASFLGCNPIWLLTWYNLPILGIPSRTSLAPNGGIPRPKVYAPSLKLAGITPENRPGPNRKGSYSLPRKKKYHTWTLWVSLWKSRGTSSRQTSYFTPKARFFFFVFLRWKVQEKWWFCKKQGVETNQLLSFFVRQIFRFQGSKLYCSFCRGGHVEWAGFSTMLCNVILLKCKIW